MDKQQFRPTVMVIFGATGDLMRRKLLPALVDLEAKKLLPQKLEVVGVARREFSDGAFRQLFEERLGGRESWRWFKTKLFYHQGTFGDTAGYEGLARRLLRIDKRWRTVANKLFYLAVPPSNYLTILNKLADSGLTEPRPDENGWTRVLVEKPFGTDLKAARSLDKKLGELFKEEQVFRIDHYLGKETVRNVMAFRFGNPVFEPVWSREYVERVEVQLIEKDGVEGRGPFYDGVGQLRDVGQNHLLQMMALTSMERPASFSADAVRDARVRLFQALRCLNLKDIAAETVRGQYRGYRSVEGVERNSATETYFRLRFFIDNERWRGVPFFMESGKALDEDRGEIAVYFKDVPEYLFPRQPEAADQNVLRLLIQPEPGIRLRLLVKRPGFRMDLTPRELAFDYSGAFDEMLVEAYEKVLVDCFAGDQMLFARTDEVEASWRFVATILEGWRRGKPKLLTYKQGSRGPRAKSATFKEAKG